MFRKLLGLPKTVWFIGLISLVNDTASELLYPLIPLYLTTVLMAGPRVLGLIEGVAEATASIFKLISGVVVDKTKKTKVWIVLGYFLAGFGRPLIAFVSSWGWILMIRFTDRMGKGLRSSPRDALLAQSVSAADRGLTFGLHRSLDNAGAVIGPILASILLANHVPLREIFLWALLPAVIVMTLMFFLEEPKNLPSAVPDQFHWTLQGMPQKFKYYLLAVGFLALGNSSDMFLLLRLRDLGVSMVEIPLIWAGVSFITSFFGMPLSALSDRYGRAPFILSAWIAFVLFYLGLSFSHLSLYTVIGLFGLYGFFKAATEGVEKALVADLAPEGLVGTAFGWFNLISGLMILPSSIIFGWLYERFGTQYAFIYSASCAMIAVIILLFAVFPRRGNQIEPLVESPQGFNELI
ncbi:MFS transporter [Polynucleobacter kasalickyi]|uniref:Predicted arabinose efflux permease, MFS family n=1 Tax=Polynucleobacter kasalickyi TaxID=1938817 RepID=A0A1W2C8B2_9BURK|nr:MFS transporter [Polynucleobacter kasalickyi]SMC81361.1 Predicted arabinose efflux permease, MFS family [Polynucleobacter kasalickyi]